MSKAIHRLSLRTADLWQLTMLEGLNADCVPSPDRQAWILATYPPEETGRPGIIVSSDGRTHTKEIITELKT